jgi:hypothetical protein
VRLDDESGRETAGVTEGADEVGESERDDVGEGEEGGVEGEDEEMGREEEDVGSRELPEERAVF